MTAIATKDAKRFRPIAQSGALSGFDRVSVEREPRHQRAQTIRHADGEAKVTLNQKKTHSGRLLGRSARSALKKAGRGSGSPTATQAMVVIDAVQWIEAAP